MPRLVIGRQGAEGLGIGLPEVLTALGSRVSSSVWSIGGLHYISRDESDIPAFHGGDGARILGTELISSLPNLLLIIDGEFRAFEAGRKPWVTVRAVDSSWWEVVSEDGVALSAIRERFRNVDEQP